MCSLSSGFQILVFIQKFFYGTRDLSIDPFLLTLKSLVEFQFTLNFYLHIFSAICPPRSICKGEEMTEKKSKSALMCWFWLPGYLHTIKCLFVFLSGYRLFHLSKLILLPSVPAAFITMAAEHFVLSSSTLYSYLQICPEEHCETKAQITISEIYLFVRTISLYKQFNY